MFRPLCEVHSVRAVFLYTSCSNSCTLVGT
jgi:hypothetical protein